MLFGVNIISGVSGGHGSRANSIYGNFYDKYIHIFNIQTVSGRSTEIPAEMRKHPYEHRYINDAKQKGMLT